MTASGTYLQLQGLSVWVYRQEHQREAPTLVFLHDSLGCAVLWRDFPAKLAAASGCNLLVYDRPGYGRSGPMPGAQRTPLYLEEQADFLDELLGRCGISSAILFGHSDGASIALIAAAKYPARIVAVISEAAHIFVEEETLAGIRAAVHSYQTTHLKQRLERYHGEKTDTLFRAWTETWLSPGFRHWNIEHFLTRITCPVLVVQGSKDEYGTEAQVRGIVSAVKGTAVSLLLPDIGHTPHKEAANEVLRQCVAFLNYKVQTVARKKA